MCGRGGPAASGAAGIVASVQPPHLLRDIRFGRGTLGVERSRNACPLGRPLEAGTVLAFGSGAAVGAADPGGFRGALARRDGEGYPRQGPHLEECSAGGQALAAYTRGRQWCRRRRWVRPSRAG